MCRPVRLLPARRNNFIPYPLLEASEGDGELGKPQGFCVPHCRGVPYDAEVGIELFSWLAVDHWAEGAIHGILEVNASAIAIDRAGDSSALESIRAAVKARRIRRGSVRRIRPGKRAREIHAHPAICLDS
jgi:hypothetical protein